MAIIIGSGIIIGSNITLGNVVGNISAINIAEQDGTTILVTQDGLEIVEQ